MIKADNTQKRCFVACDEQTRKNGRCSCLTNTHQALQLKQTGVGTCFLEDYEDHFFEVKYKQVSCCKISPITNENYCPNCGKKILK